LTAQESSAMHAAMRCLFVLVIVTAGVTASEVRVRQTAGGPQIFVANQPIAPRCFFGSRRGGSMPIDVEWRRCSFEFVPGRPVNGRGTLHFRFRRQASQLWLRKVRILEVGSGMDMLPVDSFENPRVFAEVWNIWPLGDANTVGRAAVEKGVLHVTLQQPPDGDWPDFHLHSDTTLKLDERMRYRCEFEVRAAGANEISPAVHTVDGGVYYRIGANPGPFLRQAKLARDAGVRLISTSMPACWRPPEEPSNWSGIDVVMRRIIDAHPTSLIVPRVSANAPGWWLERHPETRMMFEGGKPGKYCTVSSRKYRRDVARRRSLRTLRACIRRDRTARNGSMTNPGVR